MDSECPCCLRLTSEEQWAIIEEVKKKRKSDRIKESISARKARGFYQGPRPSYDYKKIRQLIANGLNNEQVSAEIGCSPSPVRDVRRQMEKEGFVFLYNKKRTVRPEFVSPVKGDDHVLVSGSSKVSNSKF